MYCIELLRYSTFICSIKEMSSWLPHRDAEMKQPPYRHFFSSSSSSWPSNKCITCLQSTLHHWSWLLFYADPFLGCDNRNLGLSCWTSCLLHWSQLSAFIISGKASERMFTHWDCVHSPQCFSFQRILFLSLRWGLACEGRQIGVWAVTRLLFWGVWKVQTSLSWRCREGERGIDSEWEGGCEVQPTIHKSLWMSVSVWTEKKGYQKKASEGERKSLSLAWTDVSWTPAGFVCLV